MAGEGQCEVAKSGLAARLQVKLCVGGCGVYVCECGVWCVCVYECGVWCVCM